MSTKILLIRHAEVENPKDIEYMRLPGFRLSAHGEAQAKKLSSIIRGLKVDRIFASPLERTKQTAQILSDGRIPIRYKNELLEANFKKWEGVRRSERDPKQLAGWLKDPVKFSIVLGESLFEIKKRAVGLIIKETEKHQGETIAFVTHASPIAVSKLFFDGRPLSEFQKVYIEHASITTIILDDELKCKSVRYHEYVK